MTDCRSPKRNSTNQYQWSGFLVAAILLMCPGCGGSSKPETAGLPHDAGTQSIITPEKLSQFERELEALADSNSVPGLSAAIVHNQQVIWSSGFGFADRENQIPATPDTPYRLASVSKTFAAIVLMQLVDEDKLTLDTPMNAFTLHPWFEPDSWSGAHFPERYDEAPITVRHVLSHTSESTPPGASYSYNGNIFADLTWVVEDATNMSYPDVLRSRILQPLNMTRTLPGHLVPWRQDLIDELPVVYNVEGGVSAPATYPGFGIEPGRDITPWKLEPAFRLSEKGYTSRQAFLGESYTPLSSGNTASGVISTVLDLAKLDVALDNNTLISEASKNTLFTAHQTPDGETLPYGLGWFVEEHLGTKLIWHYGWYPPVISALYLKVPDNEITLLLLSNSDRLSADYSWTAQGVQASPYARLFLERFVF